MHPSSNNNSGSSQPHRPGAPRGPRGPRPNGPRPGGGGRPGRNGRRPFGGQARAPRRPGKMRLEHQTPFENQERREHIPPVAADTVRVIALGGVEEVGRNMVAIEFGDDIFIIDAGFQFSEPETPGIDYILPNTGYLEERKHKIRGIIITHGHLDHVGAIPYIAERIGNPTIYTRKLTA
ncbi:MAG TPA: MBL fold metallo-hydrolase, partial [Candidatus Paceibacterota bacterium]|nr:MBL fold metallo-hydrolase [Candidatus Paceibacterota bacterium]